MSEKQNSKVFIRAGKPVGIIGGTDNRCRREDNALVVMPDERWGNPLYADACLDERDFHIHARLSLDRLTGNGASVLLGGHYHYSHSLPEGNETLRICLDEDIRPADRRSLDKEMYIVYGRANPLKKHWALTENMSEKQVAGPSKKFIRPGEPFDVDIFRRGEELIFGIDGKEVFRMDLNDDNSPITQGHSGDGGWPIALGFLPGHSPLRIHEFSAEGRFPEPVFPATDPWQLNTGGYSHYRLPSLCMSPSGRLLAFTEARHTRLSRKWEWERALVKDEWHCVMKSSDDSGRTWSEQEVVIDQGISYAPQGPGALPDRDTGEIFLFTQGGPWVISTEDDGRTWSEPRWLAEAAPGGLKDFKPGVGNCAIQLRHGQFQGRLMVALNGKNIVAVIFSDDHGKTWRPGAYKVFNGAGEPSLVELSDGRVIVSPRLRGRSPGRLMLISNDGGCTFTDSYLEKALPMSGQGEIVACEPLNIGGAANVRPIVCCGSVENKTRLTLKVSLDDGRTWPISRVIDEGCAANLALVALPGSEVGVLYERDKYHRLTFQRVDLKSLINSDSTGSQTD